MVALAELGIDHITVAARNADNAARVVALATESGMKAQFCALDSPALEEAAAAAAVLVSTLPADVAARYAPLLAGVPVLLDAIYDPWPTPLAARSALPVARSSAACRCCYIKPSLRWSCSPVGPLRARR